MRLGGSIKLCRKNRNWLRYRTQQVLKTEHPDLFLSKKKRIFNSFKTFITDGRNWWFVSLSVLGLFLMGSFFKIGFIDYETSTDLLNNRIRDLAALFSISLVVLGFMLNNIAQKSTLTLKMLFKETYIYPITYYSLTVIGGLIAISTFVDLLPEKYFKSLVITGVFLIIILLFFIGFMFRKAFLFVGKLEVERRLKNEFLNEGKRNMIKGLVKERSSEIFSSYMKEKDIDEMGSGFEISFSLYKSLSKNYGFIKLENQQIRILDVNLESLRNKIKKTTQQDGISCRILQIGGIINEEIPFLKSSNNEWNLNENQQFLKDLILKKVEESKKETYIYKEYFEEKFNESSLEGDHIEMARILEYFLELYNIQFRFQDKKKKHKEIDISPDITDGIDWKIRLAVRRSIEQDNQESFVVLTNFLMFILMNTRVQDSFIHFRKYIYFPSFYYREAYINKGFEKTSYKIYKFCSEDASRRLKNTLERLAAQRERANTLKELDKINKFAEATFEAFNQLLYDMIKHQDYIQFNYAIKNFRGILDSNIYFSSFTLEYDIRGLQQQVRTAELDKEITQKIEEIELKSSFWNFFKHTTLGLRYWNIFLFSKSILSKEMLLKFNKHLEIPSPENNWLEEFLDITKKKGNYLGWATWDYIERQSGVLYSPPDPLNWLTLGFLVDSINENHNIKVSLNTSNYSVSELNSLISKFTAYGSYFKENFEEYKEILGTSTEEELSTRLQRILKELSEVKEKLNV